MSDSQRNTISLHEFVREVSNILFPETKFVNGAHVKAICEHLEAIKRGDVERAIDDNVKPPRFFNVIDYRHGFQKEKR